MVEKTETRKELLYNPEGDVETMQQITDSYNRGFMESNSSNTNNTNETAVDTINDQSLQ
ncbi:hypothetical protein ACNQFZ_15505 [Schinkia sp. CFF1]